MANTIYYGTSATASDIQVKQVVVQGLDSTIVQESDFLNSGDVLMVYFSHENKYDTPYIKLFNGDISHPIAASTDIGNQIKIQTTATELSGIWSNGEVCSFVYTKLGNTFYWNMVSSSLAEESIYGQVKIVHTLSEDIDDEKTTASVSAIKALVNQQYPSSLAYIPNGAESITIGTLKLLRNEDILSEVVLKIPEVLNPETFRIYTHELYNDGPRKDDGATTDASNVGYGLPYITRLIPGRLVFRDSFETNTFKGLTLQTGNTEFQAYQIADANGHSQIKSQKKLTLKSGTGYSVVLDGSTTTTGVATFNTTVKIPINDNLQTQLTNLGWWNDVK